MNCDKCHELLSDFLDGTMAGDDRALLRTHLDECLSCACVREDIYSIVGAAHESRDYYAAPPNEQALWLRIRNTIEGELEAQQRAAGRAEEASATRGEGFWSRWTNRRWSLSLPQLAGTVAAIAIGTSLATTYSVQQLRRTDEPSSVARTPEPITVFAGDVRQQLKPDQLLAIEYLKQRVDQRRGRWNTEMREAFDRNLSVIDETVNDCLTMLDQSPHDEISKETLNMAVQDKMELLKEFSEL